MEERYILAGVSELRRTFEPWVRDARRIQSMFHPVSDENNQRVLTSAALMSSVSSDALKTAEAVSEYVSGRMSIIKHNVLGRGTALPPKIEPAVHVGDKIQQVKQREFFQSIHGIHNVLNETVQDTAMGTSWDHAVLDSMLVFGKSVTIPQVTALDGNAQFAADLIDPTTVYHDFNSWPWRCARDMEVGLEDARDIIRQVSESKGGRFTVSKEAENEFALKEKEQADSVKLTEFWNVAKNGAGYTVSRALLINDKIAGQYVTDWDRNPIVIQVVGASSGSGIDFSGGTASGKDITSTRGMAYSRVLTHAQSVFAPLYYINQQFLQYMSVLMEGLQRAMNPGEESIVDPNSGEEAPDKRHRGPGSHDVHGPGRVTKIQEQATAQIGEAARIFTANIDAEFNRLAPEVLFGQSNPGDSGYMQVIKVSHAAAVFQETTRGASLFEKRVFDQLVHLFKRSGLQFKVASWKQLGKGAPQIFPGGDFAAKDLPDQYLINVEWLTDYASNDAAKLEQFMLGAGKAFSARQGRANILGDDDPDLTQQLIDQEAYEATPVIQAIRMLYDLRQEIEAVEEAARKEKRPKLAFELMLQARFLKSAYASAQMQLLGQAQGQPGQETSPSGLSSSTMPPEMGVGTNPDRNAQAKGQVSSFTGGKPRVSEVA